jgi:hypothetical protein
MKRKRFLAKAPRARGMAAGEKKMWVIYAGLAPAQAGVGDKT